MVKRTERPFWQAASPRASAICVLPTPEAPEQEGDVIAGDQAARDPPSLGHGASARRLAFETQPIFLVVSVLEPQLVVLLGGLSGVRQPIVANDLCGPVAALALASKLGGDTGQEDAHGRQPLLAVDDPANPHHARRAGLGEGEERAAVVRCIGAGDRDREQILDQPLNIGLALAIAALPARHDVLDRSVQEFQELDVVGVHVFTFSCLQHDLRVRVAGGEGVHPGEAQIAGP